MEWELNNIDLALDNFFNRKGVEQTDLYNTFYECDYDEEMDEDFMELYRYFVNRD